MKVHLFGLPKSAHIRLKDESRDWTDAVPDPHEFRATPLLSNELGKVSSSEIDELAKAVGGGFNHLVLAGVREWRKVYSRLHFDCRIHLDRIDGSPRDLEWPTLQNYLHAVVAMDELWLRKFSPTSLRHPLLLPPTVFETNRQTADFWQQCDVYRLELFANGEQLLAEVERHHRRTDARGVRSWLDNRKRRYKFDHSKHAPSQADRAGAKSYRFCFEMPSGFHYDMTDDYGRAFRITINGRSQWVTHCNVTPWGRVRP